MADTLAALRSLIAAVHRLIKFSAAPPHKIQRRTTHKIQRRTAHCACGFNQTYPVSALADPFDCPCCNP